MSDFHPQTERPSDPTPTPQRRVGRYVQYYLLGRGGMGSVYLSRLVGTEGFERWVAIKQLHEHLTDRQKTVDMFLDEARTTAQLNHPNVVQVTDFGVEGRTPYLVMEYVNGESVAAINHRCRKAKTHIPYALAARIVASACDGLHHAHELTSSSGKPLDLVHRDVSPQNILVSYDGAVKITDFGIAKVADRAAIHTKTGEVKGKTAYMAPEQVTNESIDRRTDIFALGIILYEMTAGRRLFRTDNEFETMRKIKECEIPSPKTFNPEFPDELEQVLQKALQRDAAQRYETARAMQRDLEAYLARTGEPVGSVEVAEYMREIFGDRLKVRVEKLRSIPDEEVSRPSALSPLTTPSHTETGGSDASQPLVSSDTGITSLSLTFRSKRLFVVSGVVALGLLLVLATALLLSSGSREGTSSISGVITKLRVAEQVSPDAGALDGAPPSDDVIKGTEGQTTRSKTPRLPAKRQPRQKTPPAPPGKLSVMATPWCDVFLDGKRLGRTPIIGRRVPSGRHTLRLLPRGKQPAVHRRVVIRANRETPVNVKLDR